MEKTKQKIDTAVREYVRLFPDEFERFKKSVRAKQDGLETKWAELEGSDKIERHLFDIPETLYRAIKASLTEDELDWMFAQGRYEKDYRGVQWFMRTYKDFIITEDF